MTPMEAYLYAASWGSLVRSGDPGACMYGFTEDCRPQSEEHRQDVIHYVSNHCRPSVVAQPENYDDGELERMEEFLAFIAKRECKGTATPFIIEISTCGSVTCCLMSGEPISPESVLYDDLMDCAASGNIESACQYVLEHHKPEIRTVRKVGKGYKNVLANAKEKKKVCKEIYCDSDTDFSNVNTANMYLVWEAAASLEQELCEQD